ncbi:uncharacterized protein [Apostichopus japonicus]
MDQYGDGTIEQFITRGQINRLFAEMPSDRGQQPGTVAAYISAYLKFLKWLLLETKIAPVHFQEASNCLSGIKTSVYKQRKQREGRLEAEADELLIDSQDIDTFNRSQYKKNLRQKLRRTDRQGKIDQQTHDDIRNYLMLEVVLANRQRASAVANMTVENQIRARKQRNSEGEDMWTMLVSDHKTVTTYGAATLALNTELFTDLTFYIEEIRGRMPPNQWETVFGPMWLVYWSGEPIQSKRVTRLISSSWLNAGLKSQISTTLLRKTIVSKCFEEQPSALKTLASHMTHTEKVQQKYYLVSQKRQNAVETAGVIRSVTEKSKTPTVGLKQPERYLKGATLAKTDKNEDKESTTSDGTASTSSQMWSGIRHRKRQNPTEWTDSDDFLLRLTFDDFFANKTTPTTDQVQQKLDRHQTTKAAFLKKLTLEQIRQKLTYKINKLIKRT